MKMKTYKVILNMSWEFIVISDNEFNAINKINKRLLQLLIEDGFSILSSKANQDIIYNI